MVNILGKSVRFVSELPELFAQWDRVKNVGIDPANVPVRSMMKYWFRCPECGHSQWTSPFNKTLHRKVGGCRACNGQTVCNYDAGNSFGKVYPNLVQYWDFEKNRDTPLDVTSGSAKKRWFKCRTCGVSHEVPVYVFPMLEGCAKCRLIASTSFGEFAVAYYIKKCGHDVIHNDRVLLDGLELDIVVPDMKIAIEYDGYFWHSNKEERDIEKHRRCNQLGYKLFRVVELSTHDCVDDHIMGNTCDWYVTFRSCPRRNVFNAPINALLEEVGLSTDVDVERDCLVIDTPRRIGTIERSVANDKRLSSLWDYERNAVKPESVSRMCSSTRYWFKCPRCGRSWHAVPSDVQVSRGCNMCHPRSGHRHVKEFALPDMTLVKEWESAYRAEKAYNLPVGSVRRAAKGKNRKHPRIYAGRYWEFV